MSEKNQKFHKLTPVRDADIGIYCEALDFVFQNNDLRNIAISGAYSSGKSSVLASYKDKHEDKRFLHISLAHFETTKSTIEMDIHNATDDDRSSESTVKESVLEWKILNQLLHQIVPDKIPQTNFRVKQKPSPLKMIAWTVMIVMFAIAVLHIVLFGSWQSFVGGLSVAWMKNIFKPTAFNSSLIISGFLGLVIASFWIYILIKNQLNKGVLKKISADKLAVEMFQDSDESYFDKYLNEVLYLFEACGADVIVFEDMDRYNANRIFERLREVNTLINAQREQRAKRISGILFLRKFRQKRASFKPIRFFYLLRDDIFTNKDRTKFFDFIMPVVPVIDGSNSYDKFIEKFNNGSIYQNFDTHFLQKLSLYVDDMRLLLNIYNELIIYEARIRSTEQDWNRLLAMIAYKNLFPRDFSELQLGKGYVHTVLQYKNDNTTKKIASLNQEIAVAQQRIQAINDEICKSETELKAALSVAQLINSGYNYAVTHLNSMTLNNTFLVEFNKRKPLILEKTNGRIEELEKLIEVKQKEIDRLKNARFTELAVLAKNDDYFMVEYTNPIGEVRSFNEIKENDYFPLLKFLLRYGWIDESYQDYMNYFYPNSLSVEDKKFIRGVTDKNGKEPNYLIKDPEKVLDYLSNADLKNEEALNIFLMKFLLEHQKSHKEKLDALFGFIIQNENYRIIEYFIGYCGTSKELVTYINKKWTAFLHGLLKGSGRISDTFHNAAVDSFVLVSLYECTDKLLESINIDNYLTEHIQSNPRFLEFGMPTNGERTKEPNSKKLIERFLLLGVKFESIDYVSANKEFFGLVYKNNCYDLNYENIRLMLETMYDLRYSSDFKHKNFTLILSQQGSPLCKYAERDFEAYISVVLSACDGEIIDDENVALQIINNESLSADNKTEYIKVLKTIIGNIKDATDNSCWTQLLSQDLIAHTESNVLNYYTANGNELAEELVSFINRYDSDYDFSNNKTEIEDSVISAFFDSVIVCASMQDKHYEQIIKTLNHDYSDGFDVPGISTNKLQILIQNEIIMMDKDSLAFIRSNYASVVTDYILQYIEEYIEIINEDENYVLKEAVSLLSCKISDKQKLSILGLILDPISANNDLYSDEIKASILINNFLQADIPHFLISYSQEGEKTKSAIRGIVKKYIGKIFKEEQSVSKVLVDDLLSETSHNQDMNNMLFALILPELKELECKKYLARLGLNDYASLFEKKRPRFIISDISTRVLTIFKDRGWISKFETDEKDENYYRAYGRKSLLEKLSEAMT
jgi:hypothetical protein